MNRKELEVMAPAGNFECLVAAIEGGADSVYFGIGHLNMRSHSANNFAAEDLPEITRICREYGVNETWLRTGAGEMRRSRSREAELGELIRSRGVRVESRARIKSMSVENGIEFC